MLDAILGLFSRDIGIDLGTANTLVHVRDRHPAIKLRFGEGAFIKPSALWWLLGGGYRATPDPSLSGLATPARLSLLLTWWAGPMGLTTYLARRAAS